VIEFAAGADSIVVSAASRAPRLGRPDDSDRATVARLRRLARRLNRTRFGGTLPEVPIHVSGLLRSTWAYLWTHDFTGKPEYLVFSRRWLQANEDWESLVLHELVHLWQAHNGLAVDHRRLFRREAQRVGLTPEYRCA